MPPRKQSDRRIRNVDYTDREFLGVIDTVAKQDPTGYASTTEIARAVGFTGNGKKSGTPATKVASRLSWMRSGELLESVAPDFRLGYKEPGDRDTRWRLTPIGQQILKGSISQSALRAVQNMNAGQQVLMMRQLTQQGFVNGEVGLAFAIRREYQHNVAQRKLSLRNRVT